MGGISTGIGLFSGVNFGELVDVIIEAQRGTARRMEERIAAYQSTSKGLSTLEATVLSITTSVQRLGNQSTFNDFEVVNSDPDQLSVTTGSDVLPGGYSFQAIRESAAHQVLSKGFANTDSQTLGTGTLTIATGGRLATDTPLDALNQGEGISPGSIRIIDRSGASAEIDLTSAFTVQDVLDAINNADGVSVSATVAGGRLMLADTSGSALNDLSVAEVAGGTTAADLGIAQSVSGGTLTGSEIYAVNESFSLAQINDGNPLYNVSDAPDMRITLTDDSTLEINLDGAQTLGDVIDRINNDENNGGRVSASLANGRIELQDLTAGGGLSPLVVEDINNASVTRQLGLDAVAVGSTLTGHRLVGGLNSVLLRNLNGGAGITEAGQVSLTDRSGATTTIDLTAAESLDEVIAAINSAGLALSAEVDERGTGIRIRDTSGASASNLIIADVGTGTTAGDLKIAIDEAVSTVESGSLHRRYVSESTRLNHYAPNGTAISHGSFVIRDSAGSEATITIGSTVTTVGDVIQRINAAGISVTAQLNEFGDGFVLIDEAGGAGSLEIEELGGDVAADLRLTGESYVGADGKQRIASRQTVVIDVEAEDTLDDLVSELKTYSGTITASVFNDGSQFNPHRLLLDSAINGKDGRLIIDTGGLNLGLNVVTQGQDALLSVQSFGAVSFLRASSDNTFADAAPGVDVTIHQPGQSAAQITVSRDTSEIESAISGFVSAFNSYVAAAEELTKFDPASNQRGVLQGSGTVLRISDRLSRLVTRRVAPDNEGVESLLDLGIRFNTGGKLFFDQEVFEKKIQSNPEAVADFFLTKNTGFAAAAKATLDSLTDTIDGTFAIEKESLETNINTLTTRVEELDAILEVRRVRLLQQFIQAESIIGTLTSQQQALGAIAPLEVKSSKK